MMIGILGASGLIGHNFNLYLRNKGIPVVGSYYARKKEGLVKLDLFTDGFSVFDSCSHVVLAAGITGIDDCFRDKDRAYTCNVERTIACIRYLEERKIKPVFLSSDQVFDGCKGDYTEFDRTDPVNNYGKYKVMVEEFMARAMKDYLVLRLSKTYSRNIADGGMFAEIFAKLKAGMRISAAYNQIYNPTDIGTVCSGIHHAIKSDLRGVYHLADKNIMSRYEFARGIAEEYGFDQGLIDRIDFNSLCFQEKRALNSSLNVDKFSKTLSSV